MPINSINTNTGALVALQNLTKNSFDLQMTQNRVSTGLRVATAKDNGAIYAIAQSQRATLSSLDAVKDSLNRGISTADVALATGETVQGMLMELKEKALASSDSSIDANARTALNADFTTIRDAITKTLANATFNGVNLTNAAINIEVLGNATGAAANKLTVLAENMSLAGTIVTLGAADTIATSTSAAALVTVLDTSITNVSLSLARLGTAAKTLTNHLRFVGKLQDSIENGIGNLVDADMAKESAKLQALNAKQQLGIQTLAIANQSSTSILSLFR
jgi:flagellin